jgi:hypothetical protein
MTTSTPSSVTAEEAVAYMVNADAIPDGLSLIEELSQFTEQAELEYEKAKIDGLPEEKIESLETALEICRARQALSCYLLQAIQNEQCSDEESILVRSKEMTSRTRYTTDSITRWAVLKHGIVIREWFDQFPALTKWMLPDDVKWEDLEIRIRKDRTVSYFYKDNKEFDWDNKTLSEIDLFDMKKREPNSQAGILIGLSMGEKYPPTQKPEARHRTAMSKLRTTLRRLTGIKTDPFYPHNVADGFKPRFKLTNDEQIANERAKSRARHVGYDDEKDYGVDESD